MGREGNGREKGGGKVGVEGAEERWHTVHHLDGK